MKNHNRKEKRNKCAHVTTTVMRIDLPQSLIGNDASSTSRQFHPACVSSRCRHDVAVGSVSTGGPEVHKEAWRWRRTLDWRRFAHRQAFSSDDTFFSTLRCHMPTYFAAAGIQSCRSLTTVRNAPYFRPLPLCRIAPKVKRFILESAPLRHRRSTSSLGPLHRQPPKHGAA